MKRAKSAVEYLGTGDAAELAGMSRPAFIRHVKAGRIAPDNFIGSRGVFSRSLVEKFRDDRLRAGTKKRGPKPAVAQVAA